MTKSTSLKNLPLQSITPSATNPRKTFDAEQHAQLTENIRQHGILQPVLVRPLGNGEFELVAGERRYRAAKEVGLDEIPANVRDLTDAEAMEIQVIENLQRSELHPLEEADGYQCLISQHSYTVEDLAAKVGKSRAYIYGRLKFVDLPEKLKQALRNDEITPSVALLVARIPDKKLQKKAAEEILGHWDGAMNFRQALEHVKDNYMLLIDNAPFDVKDEMLCPSAGSCIQCPKRTGKNKELFSDIQKDDLCTDPSCFENKTKISRESILQGFRDQGYSIIEEAKASKLFKYGSFNSDKYLDLDRNLPNSDKPLKKTMAGTDPSKIHVVIDPSGHPLKLVERSTVIDVLSESKTPEAKKQVKAMTAQASPARPSISPEDLEKTRAFVSLLLDKIRQTFAECVLDEFKGDGWPHLIYGACSDWIVWQFRDWFKLKGIKSSSSDEKNLAVVLKFLEKASPYERASAFADFSFLSDYVGDKDSGVSNYNGEICDGVLSAAKRFGIDVKALRKEFETSAPQKDAVPDTAEKKTKGGVKKSKKMKK